MDIKLIEKAIREAVMEYIADEETYDDNAQLRIFPAEAKADVIDGDENDEEDSADGVDFIDVMELVKMSPDKPGKWVPDDEAIAALAEEYK